MNQTEPSQDSAPQGVTHHKIETVTTDYEKIFTALIPIVDHLGSHGTAMAEKMKAADTEKARLQEEATTKRRLAEEAETSSRFRSSNLTIGGIVTLFIGLAFFSIWTNNPGIAEKIVIGVLAFLGGMSANARR